MPLLAPILICNSVFNLLSKLNSTPDSCSHNGVTFISNFTASASLAVLFMLLMCMLFYPPIKHCLAFLKSVVLSLHKAVMLILVPFTLMLGFLSGDIDWLRMLAYAMPRILSNYFPHIQIPSPPRWFILAMVPLLWEPSAPQDSGSASPPISFPQPGQPTTAPSAEDAAANAAVLEAVERDNDFANPVPPVDPWASDNAPNVPLSQATDPHSSSSTDTAPPSSQSSSSQSSQLDPLFSELGPPQSVVPTPNPSTSDASAPGPSQSTSQDTVIKQWPPSDEEPPSVPSSPETSQGVKKSAANISLTKTATFSSENTDTGESNPSCPATSQSSSSQNSQPEPLFEELPPTPLACESSSDSQSSQECHNPHKRQKKL